MIKNSDLIRFWIEVFDSDKFKILSKYEISINFDWTAFFITSAELFKIK